MGMNDGILILLILFGGLVFGKLCGIRNQLARIADVCENADRRAKAREGA